MSALLERPIDTSKYQDRVCPECGEKFASESMEICSSCEDENKRAARKRLVEEYGEVGRSVVGG